MTYPNKVHSYYANNRESGGETTADYFVRGLVTVACLAAVRVAAVQAPASQKLQKVFKKAVQGGVATAAGHYAAKSWRKGEVSSALIATTIGAVGVLAVEKVLPGVVGFTKAKAPVANTPATELKVIQALESPKQAARKVATKKTATKKTAAKKTAAKKTARKMRVKAVENNLETAAQ